jgi:glutathione synthase/RimK-type ligase-like ATP-grasp enzyme
MIKVLAIINPPPIGYDTAYLIGRILSRAQSVQVTTVSDIDHLHSLSIENVDVIFNRTLNGNQYFLTRLGTFAQKIGAYLINSYEATGRACDKRTYLEDYSGNVPETWVLNTFDQLSSLHDQVGYDLVVKDPFGKFGKEVARFNGNRENLHISQIIANCKRSGFVAQRYCAGFGNGDKRVIVQRRLNGDCEVVAWYRRVPAKGNWISNLSAGGSVELCDLTQEEINFSKSIAVKSGLDYVGLDIGVDDNRILLIETNAYTGGHMDFDAARQDLSSGDEFAKFVCELGLRQV